MSQEYYSPDFETLRPSADADPLSYYMGRDIGTMLVASALAEELVVAEHDDLTGLPMRRQFAKIITAELEENPDDVFGLIAIDVGNFKLANNEPYGHARGDDVLRQFGIEFRRTSDHVARHGGDEYMAFVNLGNGGERAQTPEEELEHTVEMVRNARSAVVEVHSDLDQGEVKIHVSAAGIIYDRSRSLKENSKLADKACAATKADDISQYGAFRTLP